MEHSSFVNGSTSSSSLEFKVSCCERNRDFDSIGIKDGRKTYEVIIHKNKMNQSANNGIKYAISCNCCQFKKKYLGCVHIRYLIKNVCMKNEMHMKIAKYPYQIKSINEFTQNDLKDLSESLAYEIDKNTGVVKDDTFKDCNCCICQSEITNDNYWKCSTCNNTFHKNCVKSWWNIDYRMNNHCPLCRSKNKPTKNFFDPVWGYYHQINPIKI